MSVRKDSVRVGKLRLIDFDLVVRDDQSDITVRSLDPYFAWFQGSPTQAQASYEDFLSHYLMMAQQFPDSRYLIANLSENLGNFRSKEDVLKIYALLSDRFHHTGWAKKIEIYLNGKFINTSLVNLASAAMEKVVQDSSTHNLVIFSASWCIPCIEEIPLLKEIYANLSQSLVMTYISLDDEKDITSFQQILTNYDIPWRTLYAHTDLQNVKDYYTVDAIPHLILVTPDMSYEFLDVRLDNDKQRLYSIRKE